LSTWLLPRCDLTPEQLRTVEMDPYEHRVVLGPPGSGKTQILIHRAAHLAENYKVPYKDCRLFVFTNVIKEYIRSGLQFLDLPEDIVSTFDHWGSLLYEEHISPILPRKRRPKKYGQENRVLHKDFQSKSGDWKGVDFKRIRSEVLKLIKCKKELQKSLEFILVDEGQDLTPDVYEILALVARHLTVFIDPKQQIFQDGADESFILNKLNLNKRNITLLGAYRNSPYVARLASFFIADIESRKQYLAQVNVEQKIRERPLCFVADFFDQEIDRLAEIVRQRQAMNERIGIIVPTNRQLHGLASGLRGRGIEVEKAIRQDSIKAYEAPCDFGNTVPKIATFHMAKGLTFDSVLMPRLVERSFPFLRAGERQRVLFVGIARATQWVYLSTVKGKEFDEMQILEQAGQEGHLTIQRGDNWQAEDSSEGKSQDKTDDFEGDDDEFLPL